MSSSVKVIKGINGFGGPLILKATETKNKILMVTGEKTNLVAEKISKITGAIIVDGFSTGVPLEEVLVAIVDCEGTCRCGIYPKKKIKTINLSIAADYGHLSDYMIEPYYVSDVTEDSISPTIEIEDLTILHTDIEESIEPSYTCMEENLIFKKIQQPERKSLKNLFKNIFK